MARTLDDIRASRPKIDRAKIEATTEEDIRRQAIEDGEDPDAEPAFVLKRRPGQRGPGKRPAMVALNLRVEPTTLEAYKATGPGWQRRIRDAIERGVPSVAEPEKTRA